MSQTAVMRTLGIVARDFMRCRQRPPVPMQPTLSVSLAPRTFRAGTANVPAMAADFRNERREMFAGRGMCDLPFATLSGCQEGQQRCDGVRRGVVTILRQWPAARPGSY